MASDESLFGPSKNISVENEARKTVDISWDSPFHTIGKGSTQAASGSHRHESGYSSFSRSDDYTNLPNDVYKSILFNTDVPQYPNTKAAVIKSTTGTAPNDYSVFTFQETGVYNIKWDVDVFNATANAVKMFELRMVSAQGDSYHKATANQIIASEYIRLIPFIATRAFNYGDSIYFKLKPMGTAVSGFGTGWTGLYITQVFQGA